MNDSVSIIRADQEDKLTAVYTSEKVIEQDYFSNYNDALDNFFMMQSPWPVFTIAVFYLYFVLKLGPDWMANRKPFDLKPIILFYNFIQVIFSFWWFYSAITLVWNQENPNFFGGVCRPYTIPLDEQVPMSVLAWSYLMSKYVELVDTVFFVLRKKQNQVSFLHVYHHTNMAVSTWFFIKYVRGVQALPLGICNTFVHTVMYGYYLLAALGPSIQKYLWWKKYITRIQIGQFVIVLGYLAILVHKGCSIPNAFIIFAIFNTSSFLILFSQFYFKSYNSSQKLKQSTSTAVSDNQNTNKDAKKKVDFMVNNNNEVLTSGDKKQM